MSHSKNTKKGFSLYINSWNPKAKNYFQKYILCGSEGYNPIILEEDFADTLEKQSIKKELMKIGKPIFLDDLSRCEECAKVQDITEERRKRFT